LAHANLLDFDHPDAIDMPMFAAVCPHLFKFKQVSHNRWIQCLADLKACKQSNIPVYSFAEHQRLEEKRYLYGATIIIGMYFQSPSMSVIYGL
jgi:uridine kinase